MKLQLTFVCLTTLALAACGGGDSGSSSDNPKDPSEAGDGDGDGDGDESGDGDGDSSGDGDEAGDGDGDDAGDGDGDDSGDGDDAGDGDGDVGNGDGDGDGDVGGDGDSTAQAPEVELDVAPGIPGIPSVLTATVDEGASVRWRLESQPDGSDLANADIEGRNQPEASFVAQIGGEYELSAEVTLDGETTTKNLSFEVVGYDVPFTTLTVVPGEAEEEFLASHVSKVTSSGGGEPRDVGCVYEADQTVTSSNLAAVRHRGTAVRLPGAVDEPARILSRIQSSSEAQHLRLEYSDSSTECEGDTPPQILNVGDPVTAATIPYRLSPSGDRFLGVSFQDPEYVVFTWGPGGESHTIAVGEPEATPHFAWMNETTLAATDGVSDGEGGYDWSMYQIPDVDGGVAQAEVILDCAEVAEENALLPSTLFLFRDGDLFLRSALGGIYKMEADAGVYSCDATSERNTLLTGEDLPSHFDVSADGTLVTYQAPNHVVKAVVADGQAEPQTISPEDGTRHVYPHFALGGLQIVWTSQYEYVAPENEEETTPFEGNVTRVFRANADGSHPFVLWSNETPAEVSTASTLGDRSGTSCSFGLPLGGGPAGLIALGLAFGAALRRRKVRS